MRIAVIGAGNVGRAVGSGWTRAGHEVVYGVRDPGAGKNGALSAAGARVASSADAAAEAPVVVLALPWSGAESAIDGLGALAGKVVIIDEVHSFAADDRGAHLASLARKPVCRAAGIVRRDGSRRKELERYRRPHPDIAAAGSRN